MCRKQSYIFCFLFISLVSASKENVATLLKAEPTEAPLMTSTAKPPTETPPFPSKAPKPMLINVPPQVIEKTQQEMKNPAKTEISDMKAMQVTGFITANGSIYEITDENGIGKIESRQNEQQLLTPKPGEYICNYGSVVLYSDSPCEEVVATKQPVKIMQKESNSKTEIDIEKDPKHTTQANGETQLNENTNQINSTQLDQNENRGNDGVDRPQRNKHRQFQNRNRRNKKKQRKRLQNANNKYIVRTRSKKKTKKKKKQQNRPQQQQQQAIQPLQQLLQLPQQQQQLIQQQLQQQIPFLQIRPQNQQRRQGQTRPIRRPQHQGNANSRRQRPQRREQLEQQQKQFSRRQQQKRKRLQQERDEQRFQTERQRQLQKANSGLKVKGEQTREEIVTADGKVYEIYQI